MPREVWRAPCARLSRTLRFLKSRHHDRGNSISGDNERLTRPESFDQLFKIDVKFLEINNAHSCAPQTTYRKSSDDR